MRENGATSGAGVLATFAHDNLGRRVSLTRGNGVASTNYFDAASRPATLTQDLSGAGPASDRIPLGQTNGVGEKRT